MGTRKPRTQGKSDRVGRNQLPEARGDESESDNAKLDAYISNLRAITSILSRIEPTSLEPDEQDAVDELIDLLRRHGGGGHEGPM